MSRERRDKSAKPQSRELQEELAYLRQQISSLSMRGNYRGCVKMIEENLQRLYHEERWPEAFFSVLQIHRRCYPSLGRAETHEEYLAPRLRGRDIPEVFCELLRGGGKDVRWSSEFFAERAAAARQSGEFLRALGYAELLVKINPTSSGAMLQKAWVLEDLERWEEACAVYREVLEMRPGNLHATRGIARYYGRTNPQKAIAYLDEAISETPQEAALHGERGVLLAKLRRHDEAIAAFDEAITLNPYSADYLYEKGELLRAQKKDVAAMAQYRRAVSISEKHMPSLLRLAAFFEKDEPATALGYITTVAENRPEDLPAALLRARLLHRIGKQAEAIAQYMAALELEDKNPEALLGLGQLHLNEEPRTALAYYDRAVQAVPKSSAALIGRARAHERLGQVERAMADYENVILLDPRSAEPHAALGALHLQDAARSLSCYNRAAELAPKNPQYHEARARLLFDMPGRREEAITALMHAVEYDPANALLRLRAGEEMMRQGNRASALQFSREAAHLDPGLHRAFYLMACILINTEPHLALQNINAAIGLDMVNALYYCRKAQVLSALARDPSLKERMDKLAAETAEEADLTEISEIMRGDANRLALICINRALELNPGSNEILCERGEILCNMGMYAKAQSQFAQLLKKDPQNHLALYGMGRLLARKNDKSALDYLGRAIAIAPDNAKYYREKADLLAQDEQSWEEAIACYEQAIHLDRLDFEPVLRRARLLDLHGLAYAARGAYRRVLLIHRNCREALVRLGEMLWDINPDAALVYLDHAIELEPEEWSAHALRARALYAQGCAEEGEQAVLRALELAGDRGAEIYFRVAEILSMIMPAEALKYCELAARRYPDQAENYMLYGDILLKMGEADGALAQYLRAAELAPGNAEAHLRVAQVRLMQEDMTCLSDAEAALALAPKNADALYLKARILSELSEPPDQREALACAEQALELAADRLDIKQKQVELLKATRSLRYLLENRRLAKMRQEQERLRGQEASDDKAFGDDPAQWENDRQ